MINFSKFEKWLEPSLLMLVKHGSHAYGLNTPESDLDLKGICIPPINYFLGAFNHFEQAELREPEHNEECVIYDIRKFFILAANCNPNIIEVLWVDPTDIVRDSVLGAILRMNRNEFLSRKAKFTFSGYAMAQLKRINTHRRWLLNPPQKMPTREEFGLPAYNSELSKSKMESVLAEVQKQVDTWNLDLEDLSPAGKIRIENQMTEILTEMKIGQDETWMAAARHINLDENTILVLDRERHYKNAKREYVQYENWKKTRNPKRAALEEKYGLDTKHASHLIRLMRMCEEILTTGEVRVKRPDREELLGIRNGSMSYDDIVSWAEEQDKKLDELYDKSPLPKSPNRVVLDQLCMSIVDAFFSGKNSQSTGEMKIETEKDFLNRIQQEFLTMLRNNPIVSVMFNSTVEGVIVPEWLMNLPEVVLQYGLNLATPIPDLLVGEDGIRATLSFSAKPFVTFIPWKAVIKMYPDSPGPVTPGGGGRTNLIALKGGKSDTTPVIENTNTLRRAA